MSNFRLLRPFIFKRQRPTVPVSEPMGWRREELPPGIDPYYPIPFYEDQIPEPIFNHLHRPYPLFKMMKYVKVPWTKKKAAEI